MFVRLLLLHRWEVLQAGAPCVPCHDLVAHLIHAAPRRFAKSLMLGLAFACNFGGMVTPISSMQNVVAQQTLEVRLLFFVSPASRLQESKRICD